MQRGDDLNNLHNFTWVDTPAGPALACAPLRPFAQHLFTTRAWALGSQTPTASAEAWQQVASALDVAPDHLIRVRQVHGRTVRVHTAAGGGLTATLPEADIIVSDDRGAAVAIQTADCVPILMADRRTGAVAAAHAGWRGLAARVPYAAVEAMSRAFGSHPEDLVVAVGPSISAARYEVGGDVRERFDAAGFPADHLARWFTPAARTGHWYFDGWQSAADQLDAAGVPRGQTYVAALCTAACPEWFCSYRRDGKAAGRIAAAIRAL